MVVWVVCWIVVPLVVLALSIGLGLLTERLTGAQLAAPMLVAMGMCSLVVVTTLLTAFPLTVPIAGPVLLVLALAGWVVGRPSLEAHPGRLWSGLAALATFVCYSAPVALSGGVSWAGFIKLDDSATWMAYAERLASAGYVTDDLPHSTYASALGWYASLGYPQGAFAPLGVVARLTGQDVAFIYQPYMAAIAAGLAWALYAASQGLVARPTLRALIAVIAATSTLLFGFVMWGGIKEITLALLLTTCCVLLTRGSADGRPLLTQAALFAIPMAGVYVVFGIAGAAYLVPLAIVELVLMWRWYGWRPVLRAAGVFLGVFLALSIPALALLRTQVDYLKSSTLLDDADIGNLFGPLRFWQIFGVWPTGDFRVVPEPFALTVLLVAVVAAGVVGGVVIGVRRRLPTVPVFVLMSLLVSVWTVFGNAWLEGKALAVASPAMLLAAGVGFAAVAESGRRFEGLALIGLVGVGVLASNVMVYREVWIAPSDRMQELATIGTLDIARPALILEYNPPAARYFLRFLEAEGAGELRYNEIPMYSGKGLGKGEFADIDDFPISTLAAYPTLVLRTELTASRPPSTYALERHGTYYDVWTPDPAAPAILSHRPLGDHSDPAANAPCEVVREAISVAGKTGRIATVVRPPQVTVPLATQNLPSGWLPALAPGAVSVTAPGTVITSFDVPSDGTYLATIGGQIYGGVTVTVDGQEWYSAQGRLNWAPYSNPMPPRSLTKGTHTLAVTYSMGWGPGQGFTPSVLGPIVLSTSGADVPVTYVATKDALALCGQRLDWVEAVAG